MDYSLEEVGDLRVGFAVDAGEYLACRAVASVDVSRVAVGQTAVAATLGLHVETAINAAVELRGFVVPAAPDAEDWWGFGEAGASTEIADAGTLLAAAGDVSISLNATGIAALQAAIDAGVEFGVCLRLVSEEWTGDEAVISRIDNLTLLVTTAAGYDLFLACGRSPDPAVDVPVRRLPSTATADELDATLLGLIPDHPYVLDVRPFLPAGYAEARAAATFRTDGLGSPHVLPSPVGGLQVDVRAGGEFLLWWTYDERRQSGVADGFRVRIEHMDGGGQPIVADVTHTPPQRGYCWAGSAAEGRYRAKVVSMRGGVGEEHVATIDFALDATAPAQGILGLTAA